MLGVDEETIRAGLQELRATYGPQLKAALKAQLDEGGEKRHADPGRTRMRCRRVIEKA
jgi:hypothetical protein